MNKTGVKKACFSFAPRRLAATPIRSLQLPEDAAAVLSKHCRKPEEKAWSSVRCSRGDPWTTRWCFGAADPRRLRGRCNHCRFCFLVTERPFFSGDVLRKALRSASAHLPPHSIPFSFLSHFPGYLGKALRRLQLPSQTLERTTTQSHRDLSTSPVG